MEQKFREAHMDLKTIHVHDLHILAAALGSRPENRVFRDALRIITRELARRYEGECLKFSEYSEIELSEAAAVFAVIVEDSKAAGMKEDYPGLLFVRHLLSDIVTEGQRRESGVGEVTH